MKRSDWLKNKGLVKPDAFDSSNWSAVADEIVEILFNTPRFKRVTKADKSAVRLMIGASFFDASREVLDPPRPNTMFNVVGTVTEFGKNKIKMRINTIDTGLIYDFTWQRGRLSKKQVG